MAGAIAIVVAAAWFVAGALKSDEGSQAKAPATWAEVSSVNAEMQSLVFDPTDPSRQYLGTQGEGLLASQDEGRTWKSLGLLAGAVLDVGINPKNPDHLLAATTSGFMVSKDRGKSWTTPEGLPVGEYHVAQFDPNDPTIAWAGLWRGQPTLFRSTDGGENWSPVVGGPQGGDINFVSFDKEKGATYASAYGKGLFSSSDRGETWKIAGTGIPTNTDITMVTFNSDRSVYYAGTHDFGVYRSIDGGNSWEPSNNGKESASDVHGLLAHPSDLDAVYAAGMMMGKGVFVSNDRGQTWQSVETGSINLDDVHIFTLSPDEKGIVMGSGEHGGTPFGTLYRTEF